MEKMKQLNKCPNCGGTLGSIKNGFMRCEYCGGEFLSPYPPTINISPEELANVEVTVECSRPVFQPMTMYGLAVDIDGEPITQKLLKEKYKMDIIGDKA